MEAQLLPEGAGMSSWCHAGKQTPGQDLLSRAANKLILCVLCLGCGEQAGRESPTRP